MKDISFPDFLKDWNEQQNQTTPEIHLKLASWLEQKWLRGEARLLVMAFRGFGKSSVIGVFCTWLLWGNPDLRILVLAADMALARKMVRQVKRIIERHPKTKDLKPAKLDQWGSECFTLNRTKELRDPSMLAKGITTNLTGSRADIVICDDVEVPKTCDSAGKRENLRERLLELEFILTPKGTMMYAGTPHHYNTIYADERREGENKVFLQDYERFFMPVVDKKGVSAWPERFPSEKIEEMRLTNGPSKFSSQMLCVPVNLSNGSFDTNLLQIYEDEVVYSESQREPVLYIGEKRMVSAAAYWDPAFGREDGDKSIVAIVYVCEAGHHWLHHIQLLRINAHSLISPLEQQCEKICDIMERYFVPQIVVEMNGIGQFLPSHLGKEMSRKGVGCRVKEIVNTRAKNIRIQEALETPLAHKSLHVHRTVLFNSFLSEMQDWNPNKRSQKDDALDAVAGAITAQAMPIKKCLNPNKQAWMGVQKVRIARTVLD